MDSRRFVILVLAIVIMVVAGFAAFIVLSIPPAPQPSSLEQMSLTEDEFGLGWQSQITMRPYNHPSCENWLLNDSYNAYIWLVSYDDAHECWQSYESEMMAIHENINYTFLEITMGDDSFLCYSGTLEHPSIHLIFIKDNIYCTIFAGTEVRFAKSWWINTTIWIAQFQLDKIDEYLAEHPGAS